MFACMSFELLNKIPVTFKLLANNFQTIGLLVTSKLLVYKLNNYT